MSTKLAFRLDGDPPGITYVFDTERELYTKDGEPIGVLTIKTVLDPAARGLMPVGPQGPPGPPGKPGCSRPARVAHGRTPCAGGS